MITGSGGRLGRLLRAATRLSDPVGYEILFQSRASDTDICWSPGDPLDAFPKCDLIVALWGRTDGDERALAQNSDLIDISRDVARQCDADRVAHMSSAAVYGPGEDLTEDATLSPVNPYGAAKCAMEAHIAQTHDPGGPQDIVLRLANVIGADSLAPALKGTKPVHLDRFGDGHGPRRSYLGATDLLRVILKMTNAQAVPKVLNVASVASVGMEDIARAAGKDITWQPAPETAVQNVTLDISKLIAACPGLSRTGTAADLVADWHALEDAS
ncbi:NAD-dependent epimerase/dehydratase family protein [Roseovarius phycicola]|uniref:NAD-dependent epimerase/dehydratase family protein n=1 Tax=Roseovarius phycicola TaxID=3080976 RepID=A0ABZ2HDR4_9RHOB